MVFQQSTRPSSLTPEPYIETLDHESHGLETPRPRTLRLFEPRLPTFHPELTLTYGCEKVCGAVFMGVFIWITRLLNVATAAL